MYVGATLPAPLRKELALKKVLKGIKAFRAQVPRVSRRGTALAALVRRTERADREREDATAACTGRHRRASA
jgi:hypothetical protein